MIRRHLMALRVALMATDGISAALVFAAASLVRFGNDDMVAAWTRIGLDLRVFATLFGLAWVAALWLVGLYRLRSRWRLRTEARDIARAAILVATGTLAALFVAHEEEVSRRFLVLLFVLQPLVTLLGRAVLREAFAVLRSAGRNARFMLVVGGGPLAEAFANRVEGQRALGLKVLGHVTTPGERSVVTRPVLGEIGQLPRILHAQVVDEIAICLRAGESLFEEAVARLAADEGKIVRIPIDPLDEPLPAGQLEEFDGFLVRSVSRDDQRAAALVAKRVFDAVLSAVLLVVLSPVLVVTAAAVWVADGRPVLFRQTRLGLHGRPFPIKKFRTMVRDAEDRLDEVAALNTRTGPAFKADRDPRATRLGRLLRATSIDELPQLWNVLAGEMSLVGPRPPLPREVDRYDAWHRRRLSMRPGITGLWQVESRRETEFDRWVERDLAYIDHWSLALDVKILARTLPAVLLRPGR